MVCMYMRKYVRAQLQFAIVMPDATMNGGGNGHESLI